MAFSFAEALNQNVGDIERPKLAPLGHYVWVIPTVPKMVERGQYDIVDITMQAVEARDDVDADMLNEYGPLKKLRLRKSFLFDKEDEVAAQTALNNLRNFLEKHVKIEGAQTMPLKQALNACVNQRVVGQLRYRSDKNDAEVQYAEIGSTAPVDVE